VALASSLTTREILVSIAFLEGRVDAGGGLEALIGGEGADVLRMVVADGRLVEELAIAVSQGEAMAAECGPFQRAPRERSRWSTE